MRIIQVLFALVGISLAADPTINVTYTVQGKTTTVEGMDHPYGRSFRGVPFASPPVGDLRFAVAQEIDTEGYIDATNYKPNCQQHSSDSKEDCLYLNVYTPKNSSFTDSLPVFAWIYGGGFEGGSSHMGAGLYPNLVSRGPMVMVSLTYRVGPFGFLSTRDSAIPGNAGISDLVVQLKWIQKYIRFYGGDPTRVTIGGQSSGSEAVSFLTLTKATDGLFSQAIFHSGSAFGAAVFSYSEKTRSTSKNLATALNCISPADWDTHDPDKIAAAAACLRTKSVSDILAVDSSLPGHRMKWAPVTDTAFYPKRLEDAALDRKPYPVMLGDVHDEWLAWDEGSIESGRMSGYTRQGVTNGLKNSYEMTYWDNEPAVLSAAEAEYITPQTFDDNDTIDWCALHIQLWTEQVFVGPVLRDAKYFAYTGSKVYLFSFDYLNPNSLPNITDPRLRGVKHGYELQFLFSDPNGHSNADDKAASLNMGILWTNFILNGNPTPASGGIPTSFTWPEIGSTNSFVSLGPNPTPGQDFHSKSKFWVCPAPTIDGHAPPYCS